MARNKFDQNLGDRGNQKKDIQPVNEKQQGKSRNQQGKQRPDQATERGEGRKGGNR